MFTTKEVTVSKKFFSRYKTITEAIKNVLPGTTIVIEPGIYNEKVVIDREIKLIGNGPVEDIVLYCENDSALMMRTEFATVQGITIRQGGQAKEDEHYYAVDLTMGSLSMTDCSITSSIGNGIRIANLGTNPVIQGCEVYENNGIGIFITNEANPSIKDCRIYDNVQNGVLVQENGRGTIEGCEIRTNSFPNIATTSGADPLSKGCKIYKSPSNGVWAYENGKGTFQDCEIYGNAYSNVCIVTNSDPHFVNCQIHTGEENGIWVKEKGRGRFEECNIHSNKFPNINIESEANPAIKESRIYNSEQSGIIIHNKGFGSITNCEISDNTYSNIVISTEANPEIIGSMISNSEKNGILVSDKGLGSIKDCEISGNTFSNVVISNESNPIIKNCQIYSSKENGVWIKENGRGRIEKCMIHSNNLDNMEIETMANPKIRDSKIYNSEQCGIFVHDKGMGTIENCEISGNNFSNVVLAAEANPVVQNCQIHASEQSGVWVKQEGRGSFEDCEIHSNKHANIEIVTKGDPEFTNCKIFNSDSYGILVKDEGRGTIDNCEFYGNSEQDIYITDDSNLKVIESMKRKTKEQDIAEPASTGEASSSQPSEDLESVLAELHTLIGMENIKEDIQKTIDFIRFNKELAGFGIESNTIEVAAAHTVLYGNPGTGKTTVAKLLGKLYKAMGLLAEGHVVEVNREKLVGEFIGQTAPKTQAKIDEAIGGVLFIDEAYSLTNKGTDRDFGPEVIEVLLEQMENRKGEFIVVVAGYDKEMQQFLEANPGLQSRFTQHFHLQDYTPDEMLDIARKMVKEKQRTLSIDAEELLTKHFTALWRKRDRFFSNARTVRNYIDEMLQAQAQRCMRTPQEQWTKEFLLTLTAEDVQAALPKEEAKAFDIPINEELLAQALQQLQRMIGMEHVKAEVEKLVTLVRFYKEEGRELTDLSTHMVLVGSPGTGKTVLARILAKIYQALGILERGDLIEVNRDSLVSGYPGMSEQLITRYIDQAMGGTLFIDEAYQLTQYGADDPGHKVIEVLLKRMEDDRGKFIVIGAGYKENMEQFLDSNDGLRRRFARRIEFEDYTPSELMQISELLLRERGYQLDAAAYDHLSAFYQYKYDRRDRTFGNAGFARNVVEEAIKNLDYRMAQIPREQRDEEMIKLLLVEDVNLVSEKNS
ncbi:right-handed parallel beta-helix repeat-containing protein [Sporosarcina sp. ACRSL]|uniref:right-handed parallel beta-helix repeat-containing protein n=1 Tax=Sporosarcina sp. ACRSL TaxID=2918215 RepID=UPI001EF4A189|nr:right-handed parallel beta-helix repeat-containing protein [Sporosarcina sp. ACRSL]MCG7344045.1 right-handed parallel beta-helix repeat-containing protein [Sporosarcina sp. ACRSL]